MRSVKRDAFNASFTAVYIVAVLCAALVGLAILSCTGCTEQDLLEADRFKASVDLSLAELRVGLQDIQARAATQPSGPESETLAKLLDKQIHAIAVAEDVSAQAQSVINAIKTGTPQGFLEPLRRIPYVGPYADLLVYLATFGLGVLKRTKLQEQIEKLKAAWKAEEPAGPSPAMKAVLGDAT